MRSLAVLLLATFTAAAHPSGQSWNQVSALTVGTEVRIAAGSRTVNGQVQSVTGDALVVGSGKGQETFTRQEVARVSVRKAGHRGRNTLIGLGAGAGVGLAIGLGSHCTGYCFVSNGLVTGGFMVAGALVGTLVGVLLPSGGWREVYKQ